MTSKYDIKGLVSSISFVHGIIPLRCTVNRPFSSLRPASIRAAVGWIQYSYFVGAPQPGEIYPHQTNMYEQEDSLGSVVDVHLVLVALLQVAFDLLSEDSGPVLTVLTEQRSLTLNHFLDALGTI